MIGNRPRLGSQDSTEKQVTFQDSGSNTESSIKAKKVKFADDTVFNQEPKITRGTLHSIDNFLFILKIFIA